MAAPTQEKQIIWEGKTSGFFSLLICSPTKCKITNRSIEFTSGCCGANEDVIDIRRITDLQFHRNCMQTCTGGGTMIVYAVDNTTPEIRIKGRGMRNVYDRFKDIWMSTKGSQIY
ncbi:hypothetical protein G9A89_005679 [Geosiphon pyriformis]|nr:hypothetical protein G9A89_005679 [Geosiphon pyriformis]